MLFLISSFIIELTSKSKKNKFLKRYFINKIDILYHFAAQVGVRFTLSDPKKYFDDNIKVFFITEFLKI